MAKRLTSFPKDMRLLNGHLQDFEKVQQQVSALQEQLNAVLKRLKDANIP